MTRWREKLIGQQSLGDNQEQRDLFSPSCGALGVMGAKKLKNSWSELRIVRKANDPYRLETTCTSPLFLSPFFMIMIGIYYRR